MGTVVRKATVEDIPWLLGQLKNFAAFYGTKRSLFGEESYTIASLKVMFEHHLFRIAEIEGVGPVGFVAGLVGPHPFNLGIKVLAETFWWVQEDYRGGRAGLMLLNEFVDWGKANCDWIQFTLESHSPVADRALIKKGFKLQERNYLLESGGIQ